MANDAKNLESKKKLDRVLKIISLCVTVFVLIIVVAHAIYSYRSGRFAVEFAGNRYEKTLLEDQEVLQSKKIGDDKAVFFVGTGCVPVNRITKGITRCSGEYLVFVNKAGEDWIVNESSKQLLW